MKAQRFLIKPVINLTQGKYIMMNIDDVILKKWLHFTIVPR